MRIVQRPTFMNALFQHVCASAAGSIFLFAAGCSEPPPAVVTGIVLVDGHPAEGVYVMLHASGGGVGPSNSGSARTAPDGSFALLINEVGEAAITAFWPAVKVVDGESLESGDQFEGVYRDPRHPISQLTVQRGENNVPAIKLKRSSVAKATKRSRRPR